MYVTLALAKQHLNVESGYTADDAYITHLIEVAEMTVERHIDYLLEDYIEGEGDELPKPLQHAILLYVGDLYMSREANAYGVNVSEVPFSYDYLLSLYKDYSQIHTIANEKAMIDEICQHAYINEATGDLEIESGFVAKCRACGGAKSKAYERLMAKVIATAHINNNGEVEIGG